MLFGDVEQLHPTRNVVQTGNKRKITIIKEVDASLKPEIVYDGKDIRTVLLPKGIRAWCHLCPNEGRGFFTLEECLKHMTDGHRVFKG